MTDSITWTETIQNPVKRTCELRVHRYPDGVTPDRVATEADLLAAGYTPSAALQQATAEVERLTAKCKAFEDRIGFLGPHLKRASNHIVELQNVVEAAEQYVTLDREWRYGECATIPKEQAAREHKALGERVIAASDLNPNSLLVRMLLHEADERDRALGVTAPVDSAKAKADESRRLHREYNALVKAQRNGAKNGADVVRLTDECAAKGIILVPGGENEGLPDDDCERELARLEAMTDEEVVKESADQIRAKMLDTVRQAREAKARLAADPTLYREPVAPCVICGNPADFAREDGPAAGLRHCGPCLDKTDNYDSLDGLLLEKTAPVDSAKGDPLAERDALKREVGDQKHTIKELDASNGSLHKEVHELRRENHRADVSLKNARAKLDLTKTNIDDVWLWQGNGDDPASLSCPVVMSPEKLREILSERDALRAKVASGEGDARELAARRRIDKWHRDYPQRYITHRSDLLVAYDSVGMSIGRAPNHIELVAALGLDTTDGGG